MSQLPPGGKATALLIVMNILAMYATKAYESDSTLQDRAQVTGLVAFPFWIWAIQKNVVQKKKDLGIYSFFIVLAASFWTQHSPTSTSSKTFLCTACALMSINYFVPIFVFDLPKTFNVYLMIGCIYWVSIGTWNYKAEF